MDSFGARSLLQVKGRSYEIFRLSALEQAGYSMARLPYSIKILLENLLRAEDGRVVSKDDVAALAGWDPKAKEKREIGFIPARVLLQDFTGVPAVVDLAAMREAMAALGGDPAKVNPLVPVELVIDHSIQVDTFAATDALKINKDLDYRRNQERYAFLRWGQRAFRNFKVVPPNTGICHQVNLEHLARVVFTSDENPAATATEHPQAFPDTLVGTDSHTPMVNGLGVLGWGVGGIEAEAAMLGQPIAMLVPDVVGFKLEGALKEGATATDLVLTVAEMLRKKGVVGKFVEFYGPGIASLALADRATIGNMSPEYGATCAIFPVDDETLRYLRFTGRGEERVALVEAYMKEQGLFHTKDAPEPVFTDTLHLDLSTVEPSIAGPRRPQDRVPLSKAKDSFAEALKTLRPPAPAPMQKTAPTGQPDTGGAPGTWGEMSDASKGVEVGARIDHGAVVIAAITSCTNTSNPDVMLAAGLLAKKAVEKGLARKPWVKTSLAPGSLVVTRYYEEAGLTPFLDQLGFQLVGYGCTTCIGNSGPLPEEVSKQIDAGKLVVASVLSGNRNFEGRIHSEVRANYLMSPPLVVAYALAGRMDIDLVNEPLGTGKDGKPVYLKDIWPTQREVRETVDRAIRSEMFEKAYADVYKGDEKWRSLPVPEGDVYAWDPDSTYVRKPTFFDGMDKEPKGELEDIRGARALAVLGDSITTDHISPAGSIKQDSPAGKYLVEHGVKPSDFNSYGARRGNHEVMVRGTFANVRLKNQLAPGTEGGVTTYLPTGEVTPIYDAAMRYQADGTPTVILAGKEYGSGSSRDWAAKGPFLQGVKAAIAESFERIHRSNLIGMGIVPLQFQSGESRASLGLDGHEVFDIEGLAKALAPEAKAPRKVTVVARKDDGAQKRFEAIVRVDTPQEALYVKHGGILHYVLRQLANGHDHPEALSRSITAGAQMDSGGTAGDDEADEGSEESFPASDPPTY